MSSQEDLNKLSSKKISAQNDDQYPTIVETPEKANNLQSVPNSSFNEHQIKFRKGTLDL